MTGIKSPTLAEGPEPFPLKLAVRFATSASHESGRPSFIIHHSLYSKGCRIFFSSPSLEKKGEIEPHSASPDQAGFGWAVLLFLSPALPLGHIGNLPQPGLTSEGVSHL